MLLTSNHMLLSSSCMLNSMCMCIHTHVHTYIHTYMRTYIHTYLHTYIHTVFAFLALNFIWEPVWIHIYIQVCRKFGRGQQWESQAWNCSCPSFWWSLFCAWQLWFRSAYASQSLWMAFWPGGRDETALPLPRQEMMSPTRPAATPESASDWEVLDFSPSSSGSDRESPQLLWSPMGIRSRPLPKRAKFNHFGLVRMQRVEPERQYIAIQTR